MAVTTEMIKQLREATGAGVLDCKSALEQAGGDMEKAMGFLRQKGLAMAAKRADRKANDGVVELYTHGGGRVGVMVEVNSETDFVGRSEPFRNFAHEIALQIAANSPKYISEKDIPAEVIEHESQKAASQAQEAGKPEAEVPSIVEDQLKKFKDENVLLLQPYIRDEKLTVQQLLDQTIVSLHENIVIRRFVRWALGENSEE